MTNTMTIKITDLFFDCIIGILDFERVKEQKVIINISFDYEYKSEFIDYSKITSLVQNEMIAKKFELIETAILYFHKIINSKYPIKNLKIEISKPNIINNCQVSVSK